MDNNQIAKKVIAKSFVWKFLERIFSQGVNLVVQIILARLLLPSDFGSLAIIVAITTYAAIFVQSGLGTVIVQKKILDKQDVSTLLTASVLIALVLYIVLYFLSPWLSYKYNQPQLLWPLRVQSLILFLNAINSIQTGLLSRVMDFKTIFIRTAVAVPVAGFVGILMAYMGYGLWALVTHNLLNMLLVVLIMFVGTKYTMGFGFSKNRAKELYSFSLKIQATSLICGFGDTLRTLVIGKQYTPNELAYYDKASTYSNYVTQIVNATLQSVMLPTFSRSQDDKNRIKELSRKSLRMTAFVMFPILLWVIACAKPLVLFLLTEKWELCVPFLMILCLLRLFGCLTTLDRQVFFALGRSEIGLYYEIGLLLTNVVVLFITVPISVIAIAIGVTIVELLGTFVIFHIAYKTYNYSIKERLHDIVKPAINSSVMFGAVWIVSCYEYNLFITIILQIIIAIVSYVIMTIITKDECASYIMLQIKKSIINNF